MTVDELVQAGWKEHAEAPEAVLDRVREGALLASEPRHLMMLGGLVGHVAGEHLGDWRGGIALLSTLAAHEACDDAAVRSLSRGMAALWIGAGDRAKAGAAMAAGQEPGSPPEATLARVAASAAGMLAAAGRFDEAGAELDLALEAAAYGPGRDDPVSRTLAITGNNLACELEERADRGEAGTALMKRAAAVARQWWEVAGEWTHVKIAEYRLAMTHLQAGEPEVARAHALTALAMCDEHAPDDASHRFFPLLALAEADAAAARTALDTAEGLLATLTDDDTRTWFAEELAKVRVRVGDGV